MEDQISDKYIKEVMDYLTSINKMSLVSINRDTLSTWFNHLLQWETYFGQYKVIRERDYNRTYKAIRNLATTKSKADAEILSRDTDEWQRWQEYKVIYEDIEKTLNVLKRVQDLYEEEYRQTRYEQVGTAKANNRFDSSSTMPYN